MKRCVIAAVLFALLLCGCRPKPAVSEQVIVTGIGIDRRDGQYVLSIQAVEALKTSGSLSEQSDTATAVYTAQGRSVAEALQAFLNETGKSTYILQNQIIVLSAALCREESLFAVLDYFIRNQEGRALVDLVVCREDPAALLDITTGSDAIPAEYVSQLLEEGSRWGRSVEARLLDAERAFSGMYDAALPILAMKDGAPTLAGTALFRDGIWAGELTAAQTGGLRLAADAPEFCLYTVEDTAAQCEEIRSTLTVRPQGDHWEYHVTVAATVRVVEEGRALSAVDKQTLVLRLEEQIASDVTQALNTVVREYGSDPLGLARHTAAQYRSSGATQASVRAVLPQSRFVVTAELSLTDSGFLR